MIINVKNNNNKYKSFDLNDDEIFNFTKIYLSHDNVDNISRALKELKTQKYSVVSLTLKNNCINLISDLICTAIQIVIEHRLDNKNGFALTLLSKNQYNEIDLMWYLRRIKDILKRYILESKQKTTIVEAKTETIRINGRNERRFLQSKVLYKEVYKIDPIVELSFELLRELTKNYPDLKYFCILKDINSLIVSISENYFNKLDNYIFNDDMIKEIKKISKREYLKDKKERETWVIQHEKDMEEHRQEMKRQDKLREARMEAYDKACDKVGFALPYFL